MGKGSARRPSRVRPSQWRDNWDRVFAAKNEACTVNKEPTPKLRVYHFAVMEQRGTITVRAPNCMEAELKVQDAGYVLAVDDPDIGCVCFDTPVKWPAG